MMKSVLGIAVAIAFCSAANAADQGQGKVNFKGTVIDAPCGIALPISPLILARFPKLIWRLMVFR